MADDFWDKNGTAIASDAVISVPAVLEGESELRRAADYASAARSKETQRAYASDWRQFSRWLEQSPFADPPDEAVLGAYCAALADRGMKAASIRRRLAGVLWRLRTLDIAINTADPRIREVVAGVVRRNGAPPVQKEPVFPDDLRAMVGALGNDLRGVRDRAILLIGFAAALRRSEIVGLDCGQGQSRDATGWIEIVPQGALIVVRGKAGWREAVVARGDTQYCPVRALEEWLYLGRIASGPVFRRIYGNAKGRVGVDRLSDRHVANLVKSAALAGGLRAELPEAARAAAYAGHSLRSGFASSSSALEADVQKQLGHANVNMTRRYRRRRDRFGVNLTKSVGL